MSERSGALLRAGRWLLLLPLLLFPLYLDGSWLIIGVLGMAAAIGAIGLTVLTGTSGQLSLAHAFFLAVGAYGYAYLAGPSDAGTPYGGLGLPPSLAAILAVGLAGFAGLLFSPVAARVKGLYLGIASLALVFIGEHLLRNATPITGGYNGRSVETLSLFGFELTGRNPELVVLGVPFAERERLWYVALLALVVAVVVARRVVAGRPGRALRLARDSSAAAASMGVEVRRYQALTFVFSSLFAGTAGVLSALAFQFVVPQYFTLHLSVLYLAMVVIGGLGSVGGAVAGGLFVTMLPLVLDRFSGVLPLVAATGASGIDATTVANLVFGAAVLLIIVLEPQGLAGLCRRLASRIGRLRTPRAASLTTATARVAGDER